MQTKRVWWHCNGVVLFLTTYLHTHTNIRQKYDICREFCYMFLMLFNISVKFYIKIIFHSNGKLCFSWLYSHGKIIINFYNPLIYVYFAIHLQFLSLCKKRIYDDGAFNSLRIRNFTHNADKYFLPVIYIRSQKFRDENKSIRISLCNPKL